MNALRFFACAALLGSVLSLSATEVQRVAFTDRTFDNGLRVIAAEDHRTPLVAIQVWYRVGSKDDPEGRSGFAHLFEHMMFKSTQRMPNETLDRLTEDVGGENNAFTSDDVTVYHETVPSNHLQRLIWAEAERLGSLQVDAANFQTERDVVKEEFRQSVLAKPYGEFELWIQKASFAEHPYKRPTIGNIAELNASSLEEVRKFHATFYRPDNAVLVVVGDFVSADLQRWVDEYFGSLPKADVAIPRVETKEPPRSAAQVLRDDSVKIPLPAIAVTYLGPSITSDEAPIFQVLQQALSGGDSSRLHQSLIYSQELAQSAEFTADLRADLGLLTFEVVLATAVPVEKARAALLEEIAKLARAPLQPEELSTAKNQLLAQRLAERETVAGLASALGQAAVLRGDPELVNKEVAQLEVVTAEQVQSVAREWFTEANRLVLETRPAVATKKGRASR